MVRGHSKHFAFFFFTLYRLNIIKFNTEANFDNNS
jgi:hypothetical protein